MSTTVPGSSAGQRSQPQNRRERHRAELDAEKEPDYVSHAPADSGRGPGFDDQGKTYVRTAYCPEP